MKDTPVQDALFQLRQLKVTILDRPLETFAFLAGALMLYAILRVIYLIYFHPLAKYPGPPLARISDFWKVQIALDAKVISSLQSLHEQYGPVVRIGQNEVSLNMPSEVRRVYGVGGFLKGPMYHTGDFGSGLMQVTILSARDPATHNHLRRYLSPPYNFAFLQSLEGFCDETTEMADVILRNHAEKGTSFDMARLAGWYSFDSAAMLGFGRTQGFLEERGDKLNLIGNVGELLHLALCVGGSMPSVGWILCNPTFQKITARLTKILGSDKDLGLLFTASAAFALERINKHTTADKDARQDTRDMLSRMIGETNPTTGKILCVPELIGAAQNIIAAGGDTTRISLSAAIYFIYQDARVLAKVRAEIEAALQAGACSWPLAYKEAVKLEYMQACMKEAMRMHPAVGMTLQRVVPKGGATLDGHYFRAGTHVGMAAQVIHFNEEAYGPDAKVFRPERWLVDQEERQRLERYFLSFGQGPRICMGRNISLMEMSKFLPYLVWHYDMDILNRKEPYRLHESWFVSQSQFMVRVQRRDV